MEVEVGSLAPAMSAPLPHRPRLIAFVEHWRPGLERCVLARLAKLDADVVVVSGDGAWSFARDRRPVFAGEAAALAAAFGVRGNALFVIDHRGVVRFVHHGAFDLALVDALDATAEALGFRDHQTKLERVQLTAREWTSKCLVVGFALTFRNAPPPGRLARGTGPVGTPRALAQKPQGGYRDDGEIDR